MDLCDELSALAVERKQKEAEAEKRLELRTRQEDARRSWDLVRSRADLTCFSSPETCAPAILDAIENALAQSDHAGQLQAIHEFATYWLKHPERFRIAARVVAQIILNPDPDYRARLLKDALGAGTLDDVVAGFEHLAGDVYFGVKPEQSWKRSSVNTPMSVGGVPAQSSACRTKDGPVTRQNAVSVETSAPLSPVKARSGDDIASTLVENVGGRPRKWRLLDRLIQDKGGLGDEELAQQYNAGNWRAIEANPALRATAAKVKERRHELNRDRKRRL